MFDLAEVSLQQLGLELETKKFGSLARGLMDKAFALGEGGPGFDPRS